jgi:hypothetical protein
MIGVIVVRCVCDYEIGPRVGNEAADGGDQCGIRCEAAVWEI